MKETRLLMGMPITVDVLDAAADQALLDEVYAYFSYVDETFSTYKETSEIARINRGELPANGQSDDMKLVFTLSEETKQQTNGFFDIRKPDGTFDPSGLVKGWSIWNAAKILDRKGFRNFYIDAGGDIETRGRNMEGNPWRVGIRNPFDQKQIVKTLKLTDCGIATSGTYIRGDHIYNPITGKTDIPEIVSLTVIGPNVYEADRFATAAFAMGRNGINFIQSLEGFEGYLIDAGGIATMTTNFETYVQTHAQIH